ncbi:alpha-ketoglutarate-dependent dioxygenase alkB homolog 6-like [Oscarella lobularis]|uniref:alpha-ketoglutarate-dependent dioxygenase alkB homolog 6-like n=1 Tax=Oscarella lobularis TaxID=121494 RepID=UPI003313B4D6
MRVLVAVRVKSRQNVDIGIALTRARMDVLLAQNKAFVVEETLPRVYYCPEFITEEEHDFLLKQVYAAPLPKWTHLSNRRLQNWGGMPNPKGMLQEKLPPWLDSLADRLQDLGIFDKDRPNHVLVNEYMPGQGIMPHEDGPLFYPIIATINLGSHTLLDLYKKRSETADDSSAESRYVSSLLLETRSLVVLTKDVYHSMLHGIRMRTEDRIDESICNLKYCATQYKYGDVLARKTRVSLTIRKVLKVSKLRIKIK